MTPGQMADIHGAAFLQDRGWEPDEFASLLAQPYTAAFTAEGGFALTRTLAGESELLTLAVAPACQRRGIASRLLTQWITTFDTDIETAFLEVASDNDSAVALYLKHRFERSGMRKGYYRRTNAPAVDAILMTRTFTQG